MIALVLASHGLDVWVCTFVRAPLQGGTVGGGSSATGTVATAALQSPQPPPQQARALDDRVGVGMCGCALSCVRLFREAPSTVPRPLALSPPRLSNRRRRNRHTRWMIALVLACVGVHFRACDFAGRHSWRFLDHWNCRQRSSPPIAVGVAAGTRAG